VESGQTLFLLATNWSTNSFTSTVVTNFPPGWALVTVFVNGIPSTSRFVLVTKGTATVALGNLLQTYDGTPKSVSVTTAPPGLLVNLTYNGSTNAPINAGSYTVIGTINNQNYQGGVTNTLLIVVPFVSNSPLTFAREQHTATLLPDGKVLVAGGYGNVGRLSSVELYDPAIGIWTSTGALAAERHGHTATLLPDGKVLVVGGFGQNGSLSSVELYDPAAGEWIAAVPLRTAHRWHTATLLSNGRVLVAGGYGSNGVTNSAELYNPATRTWTATGTMTAGRIGHTATLLANGKVLVAGGYGAGFLASAEIYDPVTGTWTATRAMPASRQNFSATLLPNGKVLIAGGYGYEGSWKTLASATLYDPATGTWTATGALNNAREEHTATLLPNGKVLVTGGAVNGGGAVSTAELYDPAMGTWVTTSIMSTARYDHTATLLPNGKVLVVAGTLNGTRLSSTELYDYTINPATGSWTNTGAMNNARMENTATLLTNGQVLVVGGFVAANLYDPTAGNWTTTGSLNTDRRFHAATLLPNGRVLVAGGLYGTTTLTSAELYDPATGTWTSAGAMNIPRYNHLATLLPDGKVLVTGGETNAYAIHPFTSSAELYDPVKGTWTLTGSLNYVREHPTATLLLNGKVLAAGGYYGLNSAELYDPSNGTWTMTLPMNVFRNLGTATLLPNGQVLVAGGNGTASAELYDPVTSTWTATEAMNTGRYWHAATLLPNGKVLVAGGYGGSALSSTELFDPAAGKWTVTGTLNTERGAGPKTTLLANGKVLIAGGADRNSHDLSSAELYDVGLGFSNSWQPQITSLSSPLNLGSSLVITGSQFRGISGASGGNTQDSPSDHPVVQLRGIESGQTLFLLATNWSTNSVTSATVTNFPPGWALVTVFVNGIPGTSRIVLVTKGTATVTLGNLLQTYDGTARSVSATTAPLGLSVNLSYDGSAHAPTNAGSYPAIGTINDPNYQGSATNTLVIGKATAIVTLSNLVQTFDGTPKTVSATTTPPGLLVNLTYNGSAHAPTNTGSYTVIGTVNDQNYQGSATNTLVVSKATATVSLGNLLQTYDGTPRNISAATIPPGLVVDLTYDGLAGAPINAGSYTVIGNINDPNYQGSATNTLVIGKAAATVTLGDLVQTYDGLPKSVSVTTTPPGLLVNVTYDGEPNPPTNVGGHSIIAMVDDLNYEGGATNTLLISQPPAVTTLAASGVSNSVAVLNGAINPNGLATAWFEWGISTQYGSRTPADVLGAGFVATNHSATLTGLQPGIVYHYRVVATNVAGAARGVDTSFWAPAVTLNGTNFITNGCHTTFNDPGAIVQASPLALSAGGSHSLALKADGTVIGWGHNGSGQINIPASATNVIAVAAGDYHSLALRADGTVIGWGHNGSGQINIPASATNVIAIAAGDSHSLALRANGTVVGWGLNLSGQINIPGGATNIIAIAAGGSRSLALKADGSVISWGLNLGQPDIPASATNVIAVAAGNFHSLALRADGSVIGWGFNLGQLIIPASATNAIAVAAGDYHSLALRADGSVIGWGLNGSGQTNVPARATNAVAIAAGGFHSLALKTDGSAAGWGLNSSGQINIPASASTLNLPATVSGSVNTNVAGTYTLTYSATNALGGVASVTRTVVVLCPTEIPSQLKGWFMRTNGTFELTFTNIHGASFTVLTSTNLSLPMSNWTELGSVPEISPGQYQFAEPQATNAPRRFYRIRSP
jgi:N-acetylneuraminic acid mutarotase